MDRPQRLRTDGIETRKRILKAAGEVFAARGYRAATVAAICRRARANSAAINYHFKNKESLYVEVWRHCADEALRLYPADGGVPGNAPVRERLRGLLIALLKRMTDRGRLGLFHRLRLMEMANPTGLIDQVCRQALQPLRAYIYALLRELIGPEATEQQLNYSELSLVGPCLMAQLICQQSLPGSGFVPEVEVESLADHCTAFLVAGAQGLRTTGARKGVRKP